MKRIMLICIFSLLICMTFAGCGSSTPSMSTPADSEAEMEVDDNQRLQNENQSEETPSSSLEESTANYEAGLEEIASDFDVYAHYEPKDELFTADIENGMVQIGNTVLHMNEATIQDFVRAGADFEDPSENENRLNDMVSDHTLGISLYLGDVVTVTCYRADYGEEKICKDNVVESISVESKTMLTPDNMDIIPDLYSLYFIGGVRYTGTIEEAVQNLGTPDRDEEEINDYFGVTQRVIDYTSDDGQDRYNLEFRAFDNKIIVMTSSHMERE